PGHVHHGVHAVHQGEHRIVVVEIGQTQRLLLLLGPRGAPVLDDVVLIGQRLGDRKSTRLNSSHVSISYAVFCLKKKTAKTRPSGRRPAPGAGPAAPAPPPRATSRTGPCTGSGAPPPHRPCARRPRPSPHAPVSR